jgi:uncharacterized Zn finger protein
VSLTEESIRKLCTPQTFERAREYLREGRVHGMKVSPDAITSVVEGTRSYDVKIKLGPEIEASCTCPYDSAGFCKHIIATLLAASGGGENASWGRVLEEATEAQLREFLRRELRDESLLQRFRIFMSKGNRSIEDYRAMVVALYEEKIDRYGRIEYGSEVNFYPVKELAEREMSKKNYLEAAKIYRALFEVISENMDYVDDSDGYYGDEFSSALDDFIAAINAAALSDEERISYVNYLFQKYTESDDYFRDEYEETLMEFCAKRKELEHLKGLLAPLVPRTLPDRDDWSNHFFALHYTLLYIYVLDKLDIASELYDIFERFYRDDVDICIKYVERLGRDGRVDEAIGIAEEGLRLFNYGESEFRRFLYEHYSNEERRLQNLKELFKIDKNWDDYEELKKLSGDKWPEVREELITHFLSNGTLKSVEILLKEGMHARAMEILINSRNLYLLDNFYAQLAGRYPREYFSLYKELIPEYMDSGMGREHYRRVVYELRNMKRLGFEGEFDAFVRKLKDIHSKKPAFLDELKKL